MMLKTTYNILSFNTLNYEVEYMNNITLIQNPPDCFSSMDIYDAQEYLRRFLLNDAKGIVTNGTSSFVGNSTQEICNFHINVDDEFDFGYFHYECCHMSSEMELICERLLPNVWITSIIVCVFVLNIVFIFFSPYFVPKKLYDAQKEPVVYEFTLDNPEPVQIRYTNQSVGNKREISFKRFCAYFPEFEDKVRSNEITLNKIYSFNISKILLQVQPTKILSSSSSPIGIWSSIYNRLFLCKVEKQEGIYSCCNSSMRPFEKCKWQHCMRRLMHAILLLLIIMPWIIRLILYYIYEDKEISAMRKAADERGLQSYYVQASFAVRYLTPVHITFILCYLVLFVDSIVLGLIFNAYIKKFKRILTRCFKDMDAYARYDTFDWMLTILVFPLEKLGLYALPFIGIYWVVMLVVLTPAMLYYLIPTINILVQLVLHWCAYLCPPRLLSEKLGEGNLPIGLPWKERLFEFFIVNMCLLTLSSFLFLAVECITFFVEILVYTMVGIILNAEVTLKYVSLALMLLLYTRDSFGSVTQMYASFTESMINTLRKIEEEQVNELGICKENIALTPKTLGDKSKKIIDVKVNNNELIFKLHNVLLFIDKKMNAFRISKNFFYKTIHMDVDGCPGSLFPNFIKALRQLLMIIIFLMFVILVVSAFGDRYEVSGVSQMLATLVGGFLPWIFSNILFRKPVQSISIDNDSATFPTFKRFLYEEASAFQQSWPVDDFEITTMEECTDDINANENCHVIIVNPENGNGTEDGGFKLSNLTQPFLRLTNNL